MEYIKNGMIYQRDVDHCDVSPYIKLVTIKEVVPAVNSDRLECIIFEEIGWQAVSQKGLHEVGKKVLFIPAESVIPFELGERLEITNYLAHGRVKVAKLRGNRSEGVIVDPEIVEPYIPHILKWEDKPTPHMNGESLDSNIHPWFHKFYHMPNILNDPYIFHPGEKIYYSEKVHGSQIRVGKFKSPDADDYIDYVGSHNIILKESDTNIYWKIYREKLSDKIPTDIEFFGEIYGYGIQDLDYGLKNVDVRIFAATRKGYYMNPSVLKTLCIQYNLPIVDFKLTSFKSVEQLRRLANEPSEYTGKHMREGIVIVSAEYSERMAKCKSDAYEERRNRKERH